MGLFQHFKNTQKRDQKVTNFLENDKNKRYEKIGCEYLSSSWCVLLEKKNSKRQTRFWKLSRHLIEHDICLLWQRTQKSIFCQMYKNCPKLQAKRATIKNLKLFIKKSSEFFILKKSGKLFQKRHLTIFWRILEN